jgi:hypothetical protein
MNKVALGQVFLRLFRFSPVSIISPVLSAYSFLFTIFAVDIVVK